MRLERAGRDGVDEQGNLKEMIPKMVRAWAAPWTGRQRAARDRCHGVHTKDGKPKI
jgi:hypothetical protein